MGFFKCMEKEKIKEVIKKPIYKYKSIILNCEFKIFDKEWTKKATLELKKPLTCEEFEKNKDDIIKIFIDRIKANNISLISDNMYIKNYKFKSVQWFYIKIKLNKDSEIVTYK